MIDSLFGTETPLLVKLIIAFGVVLGLIAISTWALRRVGGSRLGVTTPRGRQPRLAVIDAAAVDTRRRLVLIRRDNVEHLIMIGGPTDVVVEQNIVRAVPVTSPRENPQGRAPGGELSGPSLEQPSRPQELPRAAMPQSLSPPRSPQQPEQPVRPPLSAEALFGAASDMSRPPRPEPQPRRPGPSEPPRPMRPRPNTRGESDLPMEVHQAPPTADTNLADMALRLEEALKRPSGARKEPELRQAQPQPPRKDTESPKQAPSGGATGNPGGPRPAAPPIGGDAAANPSRPVESTGEPRADAAAGQPDPKSVFDSLEEEMASLLNRPPGKD